MAAEQPFALLGREMGTYTPVPVREGVFRNEEIGKVFGLFYSAFGHIVRNAKEQIKKDHWVVSKVKRVNPHFKMCDSTLLLVPGILTYTLTSHREKDYK
jgi:hypothetical protein